MALLMTTSQLYVLYSLLPIVVIGSFFCVIAVFMERRTNRLTKEVLALYEKKECSHKWENRRILNDMENARCTNGQELRMFGTFHYRCCLRCQKKEPISKNYQPMTYEGFFLLKLEEFSKSAGAEEKTEDELYMLDLLEQNRRMCR